MPQLFDLDLPLNTSSLTIRPASGSKAGRPPDVWVGPATTTGVDIQVHLSNNGILFSWCKNNNKIPKGERSATLDLTIVCYAASGEKLDEKEAKAVRIDFVQKRKRNTDLVDVAMRRSVTQDQLLIQQLEKRDVQAKEERIAMMAAIEKMQQTNISAIQTMAQQVVGIVTQQTEQQKAVLGIATEQMKKTQDANDCLIIELKQSSILAQKQLGQAKASATASNPIDTAMKVVDIAKKVSDLGSTISSNNKSLEKKEETGPKLVLAGSSSADPTPTPPTPEKK